MTDRGPVVWTADGAQAVVCFVGRGDEREPAAVYARLRGSTRGVAWVEQRHSAVCVEGRPGSCGEGDALWTAERELALCVVTADCVPVVIAGGGRLAVIHAGWRGIVAGIVKEAAARLEIAEEAWIGPAIGPCCYEVSEEVAARVEAASGPGLTHPGRGARPHLDLVAAVEAQLESVGLEAIARVGPCTRCSPELLWSYRRDGPGAGRNFTFAWLEGREERPIPPA